MASTERREYAGGAKPTTITTDITAGSTSITLTDPTGWPTGATGPFFAVLARGQAAEEKIKCSERSGNTLTVTDRGVDGTSAAAHVAGVSIEHGGVADDFDLFNQHTSGTQTDPHPEYNLESLVDAKGDLIVASADNTPTRLAVGTNNQVLTAASGEATGVKWATPTTSSIVAKAYRNTSAVSVGNAGAGTTIDLNAEDYDPDGWHDNSTNPSRLTVPAGTATARYTIVGQSGIDNNATGVRQLSILKNGSTVADMTVATAGNTANTRLQSVAPGIELAAGDYVQMLVYQDSGGALDVEPGLAFTFLAVLR